MSVVTFNSSATVTFVENGTGIVRNIEVSYVGGPDEGITYSITGGADQSLFNIDASTGVLTFKEAPDFETPGDAGGDNVYNITVTADDDGDDATQDLVITVTDDVVENAFSGSIPASIELSDLDGSDGFVLNGVNADDNSGLSVSSAGDVNGDGYDDLIIGAPYADINGDSSGASYVVFGASDGFDSTIELSALDGSDGFVLNGGNASDKSGLSVSSAGDVNGDGIDDLIIGTPGRARSGASDDDLSGASYVMYGDDDGNFSYNGSFVELQHLDSSRGYVLIGANAGDQSGRSVSSAGDVNGDGVDDLIVGAYLADPNAQNSGASYVVFGGAPIYQLSSLDGNNGFTINGVNAFDQSGQSVSSAGDINGDGFDDLIIGAWLADPNGGASGAAYVVFGASDGIGSTIELSALDGSDGFVLQGAADDDRTGFSVSSAGDVNGDGFDDLIIGAYNSDLSGGKSGRSYVVFGKEGDFDASLELSTLDGSDGFAINGAGSGKAVSSAGDVNGDGIDDLIIGAGDADPNGNSSGASYVVFGKTGGFTASVELSGLDGSDGFALNGSAEDDNSGGSVSAAGDVNGDGFDDLIIGAANADPNGNSSGASYVVFGGPALSGVSAPTSSGGSGSVVAGSSLSFDGSSFNFADANTGDSLASVRIDSLPSAGTLKLSGMNVTAGQVITAADIANLTYNAPHGSATSASFTYSVSDGTDFADSPATMALTVTAAPVQPNNPPTAPNLSGLSVQENSPGAVVGSVNSNDPDLDSITYSVSDSRFEIVGGTLKLKAGQSVDFESQQTIGLTITATDSNNASQSSSFTLTVRDVNEAGSTDGDDAITGVDGDDNIKSESGDDVVSSGNGRDTIDGGTGNDDIDGGNDDDLLFGGSGQDTVKGGSGQDTLRGGSGSDMVDAGSGNDLVFAGLGDDGNDTVDGDIGNDTLGGGFGGDNISGGEGDDLLWGEVGDDSLSGGDGNDLIYNGEGSDTVDGGSGDDTIWASEGDDLLTGGTGSDLFVFGDVSGNDTITDFDASEDVLDVEYASTDFTSLADVVAAGSETSQSGQDGVLLDLGDSDSVFIIGIQLDDLTASNVTF